MINLLVIALDSNDPMVVAGAFISIIFIVGVILLTVCYTVVRLYE